MLMAALIVALGGVQAPIDSTVSELTVKRQDGGLLYRLEVIPRPDLGSWSAFDGSFVVVTGASGARLVGFADEQPVADRLARTDQRPVTLIARRDPSLEPPAGYQQAVRLGTVQGLANPLWPVLMAICSVFVALRGWPALAELDSERILPRSITPLYQTLQFGALTAGAGLALVVEGLLRRQGLVAPWSLQVALGAGIIAGLAAARALTPFLGIGARH